LEGFGPVSAFWALSALAVGSALMVMLTRTIVHAVIFLVLFFVALASLFVLLSADFVAVAQLLVYAGAIAVLVVFAILLTPEREMVARDTQFMGPGLFAGAVIAATVTFVAFHTNWATASRGGFTTTVDAIGQGLLNRWALPFEISSVLLLAAMIGAIVIVRGRGVDQAEDTEGSSMRLVRRER
jgi:NADH:ubiquinone oxidoreductase subunit 6 (subunit J)